MSKPFASRVLTPITSTICASCRSIPTRRPLLSTRPFTSTTAFSADKPFIDPMKRVSSLASLSQQMEEFKPSSGFDSLIPQKSPTDDIDEFSASLQHREVPMYHFHVYATKHNTHITLTRPNREPLISVSCGNIGFKKAARGTYDSAYQLAAYMMSRIQDKGLLTEIRSLEVVFRGFGPGREAVSKVIMSSEGRNVRTKIKKLTDATRLKFGGVRSPRPRRLG